MVGPGLTVGADRFLWRGSFRKRLRTGEYSRRDRQPTDVLCND